MLAEILTEAFHPPVGLNQFAQPWIRASLGGELERRLARPSAHYRCLIALVDAQIAGTVEVAIRGLPGTWWMPSFAVQRLLYVSNLAVGVSWRRLGVARQLLGEAEQLGREWNQSSLRLHVMESNAAAFKLYSAQGYEVERTETEWVFGPRKLLLRKRLYS